MLLRLRKTLKIKFRCNSCVNDFFVCECTAQVQRTVKSKFKIVYECYHLCGYCDQFLRTNLSVNRIFRVTKQELVEKDE